MPQRTVKIWAVIAQNGVKNLWAFYEAYNRKLKAQICVRKFKKSGNDAVLIHIPITYKTGKKQKPIDNK